MLNRTLWVEKGLCNGRVVVATDIIYQDGQCPPSLPLGVVVEFGDYTGPNNFLSYTTFVLLVSIMSQAYIHGDDMKQT